MKITVIKKGFSLLPAYEDDMEVLRQMPEGEAITLDYKKSRNPGHHRKLFVLLRVVAENMPEHMEEQYGSTEKLLTEIKFQLGYYVEHRTMGGRVSYIPKSISFDSMDQTAFNEFYSGACDICIKYFLTGVSRDELEAIVVNFM